jgi:hypothetical protein
MPPLLRLTFSLDADGTGELCAQASINGFAGRGAAWFSVQALRDFARQLIATYPLTDEPPLTLKGGHWDNHGPQTRIDQLHLGLAFYAIGTLGDIGCRVSLAAPPADNGRGESAPSMQAEIRTTYVQVEKFARALDQLALGLVDEALLESG